MMFMFMLMLWIFSCDDKKKSENYNLVSSEGCWVLAAAGSSKVAVRWWCSAPLKLEKGNNVNFERTGGNWKFRWNTLSPTRQWLGLGLGEMRQLTIIYLPSVSFRCLSLPHGIANSASVLFNAHVYGLRPIFYVEKFSPPAPKQMAFCQPYLESIKYLLFLLHTVAHPTRYRQPTSITVSIILLARIVTVIKVYCRITVRVLYDASQTRCPLPIHYRVKPFWIDLCRLCVVY